MSTRGKIKEISELNKFLVSLIDKKFRKHTMFIEN